MKRSRLSEEQIIGILREHEAGAKTADLARQHGASEATLSNWQARFGGMDVSEARRLKQLEDESAKLKRIVADRPADLDKHIVRHSARRRTMQNNIDTRENDLNVGRNWDHLWQSPIMFAALTVSPEAVRLSG